MAAEVVITLEKEAGSETFRRKIEASSASAALNGPGGPLLRGMPRWWNEPCRVLALLATVATVPAMKENSHGAEEVLYRHPSTAPMTRGGTAASPPQAVLTVCASVLGILTGRCSADCGCLAAGAATRARETGTGDQHHEQAPVVLTLAVAGRTPGGTGEPVRPHQRGRGRGADCTRRLSGGKGAEPAERRR